MKALLVELVLCLIVLAATFIMFIPYMHFKGWL